MDRISLNAAVAIVEDAGAKTGLHAAYVKQLLLTAVSDPSSVDHLLVKIFAPVAKEQADRIRETVLAAGGSEEEAQVLIYKFGQGIWLGAADGPLS